MSGCANCHPALLGSSGGKKAHPAGNNIKFSAAVAANSNAYGASGDLTGNPSMSYSSTVPFEMGHRAHASGWDHAMRWNMKASSKCHAKD
jgi:hypothetical protein